MNGHALIPWLLTDAVHSTILMGLVLLLDRRIVCAAIDREHAWKAAAFAALLTSAFQLTLLNWRPESAPVPVRWEMPAPSVVVAAEPVPAAEISRAPAAQPKSPASVRRDTTWRDVLLAFWLTGAVFGIARLAFRRRMVTKHVGERRAISDPELIAVVDDLRRRCGYRSDVRLTQCERNISPMVLGSREICIPAHLVKQLSQRQLRSVLAHELAHLQRRDSAWLLAFSMLETFCFFQPLNVLARKRVQECAEYDCDARAARVIESPIPMAETLVEVARWMQAHTRALPYPAMAEDPGLLAARVQRLLGSEARVLPRVLKLTGIAALVASALVAPAVTNAVEALPSLSSQDDRPRLRPFEWNGNFANGGADFARAYQAWRVDGARQISAYVRRQTDSTVRFSFRSRAGVCGTGVERDGSRMFALQPGSGWLPAGKPDALLLYNSKGVELQRHVVGIDGTWTTPCQDAPVRVDARVRDGIITDLQITVGNPAPSAPQLRDLGQIPAPVAGTYLLTLARGGVETAERALLAAVMGEGAAGADELYGLIADAAVSRSIKTAARTWIASLEHHQPKKQETAPGRRRTASVISDLGRPLAERIAAMQAMTSEQLLEAYDDVPDRAMRVEIIEWLSRRPDLDITAKLQRIIQDARVVEEQDAAVYALIERKFEAGGIPEQVVLQLVTDPRQPLETRKKALLWAGSRGVSRATVASIVDDIDSDELRAFVRDWLAKH